MYPFYIFYAFLKHVKWSLFCRIVAKEDSTPLQPPAAKEQAGENNLTPGSPASQHSSMKSDDEGGDEDAERKKVKKQRSFKKMFQKKPHKKK